MVTFEVNDMTCGHCARTLERALKASDPQAEVRIDLAAHRIQVDRVTADVNQLVSAIRRAGYTALVVTEPPSSLGSATRESVGCGCGCG